MYDVRSEGRGFRMTREITLLTSILVLQILQALLLRYNPFHDQTEQERVKATARRVGLDVPKEYVPGTAAAQAAKASGAASGEDVEELKKFLEGKRGPLPPPELESRFGGL